MLLTVLLFLPLISLCGSTDCTDGIDNVLFAEDCGDSDAGISFNSFGVRLYDSSGQPSCTLDPLGNKVALVQAPGQIALYGAAGNFTINEKAPVNIYGTQLVITLGRLKSPGLNPFLHVCTNGVSQLLNVQTLCQIPLCDPMALEFYECNRINLFNPRPFNFVGYNVTHDGNPNYNKAIIPALAENMAYFGPYISGQWSATVKLQKDGGTFGCIHADHVNVHYGK